MPNYSFQETLVFFGEKLHASLPSLDHDKLKVELVIDRIHVLLSQGILEGSLHMQIVLGLLLQPISEKRLKQLATSNFLGCNTAGCKLSLDPTSVSLSLHSYTTPPATPQESWEWLHRLLSVAREWSTVLTRWEDFVPLTPPSKERDVSIGSETRPYA